MSKGTANAEYARLWRLKNAEKIRAYRKANQEHRRELLAGWKKRNPEKYRRMNRKWATKNRGHLRQYHKEWEKRNPPQKYGYNHSPKQTARMDLYKARRRGEILRPDACSNCGLVCKPHGHHPDYSKPLEVIWLCSICHAAVHSKVS